MLRRCVILGALLASSACGKSDGNDSIGNALLAGGTEAGAGSGSGSAGSGAGSGSGSAGSGAGSGSAVVKAGSAAGSGAVAMAGSGAAKPADAPKAGSGAGSDMAKAGSAAVAVKPVDPPKAGSNAGSAAVAVKPVDPPKAGSNAGSAVAVAKPVPAPVIAKPTPVKPSELALIKLSLLPNWDRDIDQPGTFQYVVRIKGTQSTKTFTFNYGYDDAAAPADRDQYKKYLQDTKLLTGELKDRQRGAAWFLEGNDAAGMPAFRYQVLYGGKRLICYGSLYKDPDSNKLGDDRDQTLIQAKQICETLAL